MGRDSTGSKKKVSISFDPTGVLAKVANVHNELGQLFISILHNKLLLITLNNG